MLAAVSPSLPEIHQWKEPRSKDFSPRKFALFGVILYLTHNTSVNWWHGDRSTTKSWSEWGGEAFNSGVAGSFLEYAAENSMWYYYMKCVA